jgi:beta-galactosidase GanA
MNPSVRRSGPLRVSRPLVHGLAVAIGGVVLAAQSPSLPHLRQEGGATQVVVDGRPFLVRGGELGNSSASNLEYLAPYWTRFGALRLNTILTPIYWDLLERDEGKLDFALVDGLISEARKHGLKLVLLWFSSWKNSMSCYAPAWVKKDQRRFPRSVDANGRSLEMLSPFSTANRDADARAFAALMRHVKAIDGDAHTVLMVQVENEIGMIPDARDQSADANRVFASAVPIELTEYLSRQSETLAPELRSTWLAVGAKRTGTWTEVFRERAVADAGWQAGILSVEEGRFVNGKWQNVRWLNGDQTHQGRHLRLEPGRVSIQRINLYRYR